MLQDPATLKQSSSFTNANEKHVVNALLIATENYVCRKIKIVFPVAQGYDSLAKLLKYVLHALERGSPLSICPLIYEFIPYAMFTSYLTFSS